MSTQSFGLYANPGGSGANVTAGRAFSNPLTVGDTFSLQWAVNWDSDVGNKGFLIYSGGLTGAQVAVVNQAGFPGDITFGHSNGTNITPIAFGTGPMTWKFKLTDSTNLLVTSTARNGTTTPVFSTNITVASAPDAVQFYASAMGAGDQRQAYFNNLEITTGPEPATLTIGGVSNILVGQTNTLTITRSGAVGDSLAISNSNGSVVSAPTSAVFAVSNVITTVEVVGLAAGTASIEAVGDVTNSAPFLISVFTLPPPPTNIYDDATFYPVGWSNGSNGGNGFSSWSFQLGGGQHLIGDATINAATNASGLNTGGSSFALLGSGGGFQEATRSFSTPLVVGDAFTFGFSFQWDGQNRGFDILSGATVVFNMNITSAGYVWTGGGSAPTTPWPGVREFGVLVDASFTVTPSGLTYVFSSLQDTNLNVTGTVATASAITGFKFYNSESGPGARLHFNKLAVIPSTTPFLSVSGPTNVLDVATPVYTLYRNSTSLVADLVYLESSSPAAGTVPATATFGAGQLTTTFRLDTLAAGATTLTATNGNAAAAPLVVDVTAGITNTHDVAAYYDGDWQSGDNNGRNFGPWSFNHFQGDGGFSGSFIGNPADAGIGGMDSTAFALFANPSNANAEVNRTMPALAVGDRLSFVWGLNFDSGIPSSFRGFSLASASTEVLNISMSDSPVIYIGTNVMLNVYGTSAITMTITHESAGNLRVTATGRDGVESFNSSLIPVAGAPDSFKFYLNASTPGNERQMYFNNFAITNVGVPGPVVLPPEATNVVSTAIQVIGGQPNVTVAAVTGLYYYLVYPATSLSAIAVNPVDPGQWSIADAEAPATTTPVVLVDTNAALATNRYYGLLIRSEALTP